MVDPIKRGDIWLAFAGEEWPVVLLSEEDAGAIQALQIIPPAEQAIDGVAIEVPVGRHEGLPHDAVLRVARARPDAIHCNWLLALSRTDLTTRLGALSPAKLQALEEALRLGDLL